MSLYSPYQNNRKTFSLSYTNFYDELLSFFSILIEKFSAFSFSMSQYLYIYLHEVKQRQEIQFNLYKSSSKASDRKVLFV